MRGVITGGWNYVVAAYSVTATIFVVYAITLFARLSSTRNPRSES